MTHLEAHKLPLWCPPRPAQPSMSSRRPRAARPCTNGAGAGAPPVIINFVSIIYPTLRPLRNLRCLGLSGSKNLTEMPDLGEALNLEWLDLKESNTNLMGLG
ncbi:hypothetical protein JHK82_016528 [Glycine max]|nr:hypothetical protein JHK82_016528 [Glycine max]